MSRDALLNYATPPRLLITPRANWLAVFSFAWTFAVAPPVMALFFMAGDDRLAGWSPAFPLPAFVSLVVTPAVAVLSGYVATERGAAWDSPYRATGLAVCAVPTAWLLTAVGALLWFGIV